MIAFCPKLVSHQNKQDNTNHPPDSRMSNNVHFLNVGENREPGTSSKKGNTTKYIVFKLSLAFAFASALLFNNLHLYITNGNSRHPRPYPYQWYFLHVGDCPGFSKKEQA